MGWWSRAWADGCALTSSSASRSEVCLGIQNLTHPVFPARVGCPARGVSEARGVGPSSGGLGVWADLLVELTFYEITSAYSVASTAVAPQNISSRSFFRALRPPYGLVASDSYPPGGRTPLRRPRPPDTSGRQNPWPGPKSPTGAPEPPGPPPGFPQVLIDHALCQFRVPGAPQISVEHKFCNILGTSPSGKPL